MMRTTFLVAVSLFACHPASAEQVDLSLSITNFELSALGGVRSIIKYEVAHPNQTEIDYLLLAEPSTDTPRALSVEIQVEGSHGDAVKLADDYGADCTLARIGIFRNNREILIIKAERSDDMQHIMAGSLAQPGSMRAQVYRRYDGGEPGQSSPLFKADAAPTSSKPVCADSEVQQLLDETAKVAFKGSSR